MCTQNTTISIVSPEIYYAVVVVVMVVVVALAHHGLLQSTHQKINNILIHCIEIYIYEINLMVSLLSIRIEKEAQRGAEEGTGNGATNCVRNPSHH